MNVFHKFRQEDNKSDSSSDWESEESESDSDSDSEESEKQPTISREEKKMQYYIALIKKNEEMEKRKQEKSTPNQPAGKSKPQAKQSTNNKDK